MGSHGAARAARDVVADVGKRARALREGEQRTERREAPGLAGALEQSGGFAGLRGVVVFDRVGSPGLRLTQDLLSHPVFRGIFWEAARGRGLQQTFPVDGGWASAEGLQLGFLERSMDRVVTLSDEGFARPDLGDAEAKHVMQRLDMGHPLGGPGAVFEQGSARHGGT